MEISKQKSFKESQLRISFKDSSFVEFNVSDNGKVVVTLSAKDGKNPNSKIINSAEIEASDFEKIVIEVKQKLSK